MAAAKRLKRRGLAPTQDQRIEALERRVDRMEAMLSETEALVAVTRNQEAAAFAETRG